MKPVSAPRALVVTCLVLPVAVTTLAGQARADEERDEPVPVRPAAPSPPFAFPRKAPVAPPVPLAAPAASRPAAAPGAPSERGHHREAPEYRFDALRIDGTLRGPEGLAIRALARVKHSPLRRHHRSFVHRIVRSIEHPAVHGH